jgi:pimeloyl-ACP methyl ester carboxylesterase
MPDLRAIRPPRLGWIGTADHVIPPAAQLAMTPARPGHLVKVDASHLSMSSHPQG